MKPRRPRVPTWALALVVVALLGGAAWLFVADGSDDEADDRASKSAKADRAEDVLSLPNDDDAPTDERRRGEEGRDRLDAESSATTEDVDDETDAADSSDQPAAWRNLRDRTIALAPASATGSGDATRLVTVQDLRVPCATPAGDDDALTAEVALAGATAERLRRAHATVNGTLADSFGATTCVDARVRTFADSDVAIVFRVVPDGDDPRVIVGRPTGDPDPDSTTLASELAALLGLDAVVPATTAATRSLLARAGAIDAPDGPAVVLVELPAALIADDGALDALVQHVVSGIAAHLTRADQQDSGTDE